jgi:AcrR family transcriptional regulator
MFVQPTPHRAVRQALLDAAADTLRRLGPRQFSLIAVAEAAGVSRGTVYNSLGSREQAITAALDHHASAFVAAMAAEVDKQDTLAQQVAAAAVLICAHRQNSPSVPQHGISESVVVLLLRNIGDDLMKRAVELWKPRIKAAQRDGEIGAGTDPARAGEWIVRLLLSFELLPPIGVNLDNPRAVRRFVTDHIITGLRGEKA